MTKCPAVIVHTILAIVVVISAAALSSQVKAEEITESQAQQACAMAADAAIDVIHGRLDGAPRNATLQHFLTERFPNVPAFAEIVSRAYDMPEFEDADVMANAYGTYVYLACYFGDL